MQQYIANTGLKEGKGKRLEVETEVSKSQRSFCMLFYHKKKQFKDF